MAKYLSDDKWSKENFVVKFQIIEKNNVLTTRTFLHLPKKKKHSGDHKIEANLVYDTLTKKGILTIENTCFLNSLWITSVKSGVHFEDNLLHLLPGKHKVHFQSEHPISINDLIFEYL